MSALPALADSGAALDFDALMRLAHLAQSLRGRSGGKLTGLPGSFVHRRHGRGLEVHDIRHWQHGDDIRHIDRNATARTGVQHIRSFRDERDRAVWLIADFRPAMLFGTRRARSMSMPKRRWPFMKARSMPAWEWAARRSAC